MLLGGARYKGCMSKGIPWKAEGVPPALRCRFVALFGQMRVVGEHGLRHRLSLAQPGQVLFDEPGMDPREPAPLTDERVAAWKDEVPDGVATEQRCSWESAGGKGG